MTVPGSNTIDAIMETLMPLTMYIVQVAAINDAGYGVYSDPLTVSTNDSIDHSATRIPMEVTASTTQTGPYIEPTTSTIANLTPTSEL